MFDCKLHAPPKRYIPSLFTPWTKQVGHRLPVQINGEDVPSEKFPKLLGVTFDPTFSFSAHASEVARRASARLKMLKALSDTQFGKDKECLLLTYRVYIRSIFNYAAPIVYPNYSPSSIFKLQKIQNRALRLCLGCHSASPIDHLHREARELMVGDHLKLLSAQFLAKCLQPHHPSHHYVRLDRGRRAMKETLQSKVGPVIQPFLNEDNVVAPGTYSQVIADIHTEAVSEALSKLAPSRILNANPSDVDKREIYLPSFTRKILAQLRSGYCARLNSFLFKIGRIDSDLCPECSSAPHTVVHLFNCPAKPTNLEVIDLWRDTWATASFLTSLPSFSALPPCGPPPPPPRRRPRQRPPAAPDPPDDVFSPLSLPPSPFLFTPPLFVVDRAPKLAGEIRPRKSPATFSPAKVAR